MATINALREKLTGKINQIDQVDLSEYLLQLAEDEQSIAPLQLTDEQQIGVSKGLVQYEKGQFISDGEAGKEVAQWLKN